MPNNKKYYHKKHKKPMDNYAPPFSEDILSQGIEVLNLKDDTKNLLTGASILLLGDVLKREAKDFYRISTFNKKNLNDLLRGIKQNKLFLKPTPAPVINEENKEESVVADANINVNKEQFVSKNNNNNFNNNRNKIDFKNKNNNINNRENKKAQENARFREEDTQYVLTTQIVRPPKQAVKPIPDLHDIYVKVNKSGKWGFKKRGGNQMAVAPLYEEVFSYKDELCCVQKDDKFGFINRQGEEIIPIIYDCASSFSEGYACVYKNDKCGYIDKENNIIIDFIFDAGTAIENGECRVKKDGKWGELHITQSNVVSDEQTEEKTVELGVKNIRWII